MACVDWWGIFPVLRAKPCGCCLAHGLVGWWQVPYLPTISWYESNTMEIRGYQEKNGWRIWETLNRSWVTRETSCPLLFCDIEDPGFWCLMNRHPLWSTGHLQCSFNPHGAIMLSLGEKIRHLTHHSSWYRLWMFFFLSVGMPFCWSIYSLALSFHGDRDAFL